MRLGLFFAFLSTSIKWASADTTSWHFRESYPGQDWLQDIAHQHCDELLNLYLTQNSSCTYAWTPGDSLSWGNIYPGIPPWPHCVQLHHVVDCILANTSESGKAFLATATVLIGLLPTILGLAGSSAAEMGLLSQRRPILATLLSVASPILNPIRVHQFREPMVAFFIEAEEPLTLPSPTAYGAMTISAILQYIAAIGLGANLIFALRDLTARTVPGASAQFFWLPGFWAFAGVLIHGLGAIAFRLRFRMLFPSLRKSWLTDEATPCIYQEKATLVMHKESYLFVGAAWFTTVLTFLHILFGTAIFSSILLFSLGEAVQFTVRLLAATMISRVILMGELSGMRQSLNVRLSPTHMTRSKTL